MVEAYDTLLILSGMGIPSFSCRGATQTLTPIQAALDQRRSVNGELLDLSYNQFRKYISKITCTDIESPSLDQIWPGAEIEIGCICELTYLTTRGSAGREAVSGSTVIRGDYTVYRPVLAMLVTSFSLQHDEYGRAIAWELDSEEI